MSLSKEACKKELLIEALKGHRIHLIDPFELQPEQCVSLVSPPNVWGD